MHYSICRYCKQPKNAHTSKERHEHSLLVKEMTKNIIREPKPEPVIYPDPKSDRTAGRFTW